MRASFAPCVVAAPQRSRHQLENFFLGRSAPRRALGGAADSDEAILELDVVTYVLDAGGVGLASVDKVRRRECARESA